MIPHQQSQTGMNTAGMNTARSSESVIANPLNEFHSFDQGDIANILHDLRNSVRDLTTRMNTGLTPAVSNLLSQEDKVQFPPLSMFLMLLEQLHLVHIPRTVPDRHISPPSQRISMFQDMFLLTEIIIIHNNEMIVSLISQYENPTLYLLFDSQELVWNSRRLC